MDEMEFGDCLAVLLAEQQYSAGDLACSLHVDVSLVRRWIRNERVPSLHSGYLEHIAETLDLPSADRCRLEAAQIFSLKRPHRPRPKQSREDSGVTQLLKLAASDVPPLESTSPPVPLFPPGFPSALDVITGEEAIRQAGAALFRSAVQVPAPQAQPIITTMLLPWSEASPQIRLPIRASLDHGWDVCVLWQLDRNAKKALQLVEATMTYLGARGNYQPYYLNQYVGVPQFHNLLIVPGFGAMWRFSTNGRSMDVAVCFREPDHIDLLRSYFSHLLEYASPALKRYLPSERLAFGEVIMEAEDVAGDCFLVKEDLHVLTFPLSWLREDSSWARASGFTGHELDKSMEYRKLRIRAREEQVRAYSFRSICSKRAIRSMVATQEYAGENENAPRVRFRVTREECLEHLQNVVRLLESHPNYELALTDEWEQELISPFFWEVKGDHAVFMEIRQTSDTGNEIKVYLAITEPLTVDAFRDYFEDLWERISPRNRDKGYVRSWLSQQMDLLR